MKRLPYLVILGLLSFTLSCDEPWESDLVNINPRYMMTPQEAYALHLNKDNNGPTYSGNPAWHKYMKLNEKLLKACGVADITKNAWRYDLWHTSEWPDNSGWSLVSDGRSVEVASYGAYSGSTGASGITAQMVYYNPFAPPSPAEMAGKIVLFKTLPHPAPPYS
ncbi:MAG: hypothetical protein HKP58_04615, partial [Desulfatitalea sp.]|nr:hypothetical protein [Desulfatitalea sp.]